MYSILVVWKFFNVISNNSHYTSTGRIGHCRHCVSYITWFVRGRAANTIDNAAEQV